MKASPAQAMLHIAVMVGVSHLNVVREDLVKLTEIVVGDNRVVVGRVRLEIVMVEGVLIVEIVMVDVVVLVFVKVVLASTHHYPAKALRIVKAMAMHYVAKTVRVFRVQNQTV